MLSSLTQRLLSRENESSSQHGDGDVTSSPLLHHRHDDDLSRTTSSDDGHGPMIGAPAPHLPSKGDQAWAVAFAVNVAITLLSAGYFFPSAVDALPSYTEILGDEWRSFGSPDTLRWIMITMLPVVAVGFVAYSCLVVAGRYVTSLQIALGIIVWMLIVVIGTSPSSLFRTVGWAVPVYCGALSFCYCLTLPDHVNFVSATFKVGSLAVTSTPQIVSWTLCFFIIRYVWICVAVVAYVGSMAASRANANAHGYRTDDCKAPWMMKALSCGCGYQIVSNCYDSSDSIAPMCFWIANVMWSLAVGKNVAAATVADAVASRWSTVGNGVTAWQSFRRVTQSSLGSLCKVAAMDCLTSPLRFLVGRVSHTFWMADVLVVGVRVVVSHALLYPVLSVGVHHFDFAKAVRHARAMFGRHGWTLLINEVMILGGLDFLLGAAAAVSAMMTVLGFRTRVSALTPSSGRSQTVLFGAMAVVLATLEVLQFAFKTVLVCLVQVPEALAENHDHWPHNDLYKAWRELQRLHPPMQEARRIVQV